MLLVLIVFLGGVLTILSPCILPVLPFVFTRADRSFVANGLPMLAGMTLTFAGVATLAAVGGAWAVRLNEYGRVASLVLLAALAATLLSRRLADALARPFVALGNRLVRAPGGERGQTGIASSISVLAAKSGSVGLTGASAAANTRSAALQKSLWAWMR